MLATCLLLAITSAPLVGLERLAPPSSDDEAWIVPRAADLLADRLRLLGAGITDRGLVPAGALPSANGYAAIVRTTVIPERVDADTTPITLRAQALRVGAEPLKIEVKGKAAALPQLITQLAIQIAAGIGLNPSTAAASELDLGSYPYAVEQLLGRAEARLESGEARQALLLFERARTFSPGVVLEAIEGRARAEALLVAQGQTSYGAKAELAASALEKADAASKRGAIDDQLRALLSVLQYQPDRALRFRLVRPIAGTEGLFEGEAGRWVWAVDGGPIGRLRIDPRSGAIDSAGPGATTMVGQSGGDDLILEGDRLLRRPLGDKPRWSVSLPLRPRSRDGRSFVACGSALAILGPDGVGWIDDSVGKAGQIAKGFVALAGDSAGILVRPGGDAEVGLLRPGKKATAWRTPIPAPLAAELTRDRAVILTGAGLVLLKTFDGKPVRPPITLDLLAPRLLGADGRYAALGDDEGRATIFDVLAGETTATVRGPSAAQLAYTSAEGIVILYQTGDLFFYDRDGAVKDRAFVPGKALRMLRGNPEAPGPVILTDRGLYAYAEVETARDLEPLLALVEVLVKKKDVDGAIRLLDRLAEKSAGGIERIETRRAELLTQRFGANHPGIAKAKARAAAAKDPKQSVGAFAL